MPGKAYTMRELKQIVDYLTQNKLYHEVRGRKMWQDMAKSKIVDRTWQSLKETFLKRILPDIHNPYYKLTVIQISSFRQESDVETRSNKLEIQRVGESSSGIEDNSKHNEQPSKEREGAETSGEDVTCSKIQNHTRASTETLVLENLDTHDNNQVESENDEQNDVKSLKDLITYAEPLTPMLQEVLDDFASDEDEEPPLQIVEDIEEYPSNTPITNGTKTNSPNKSKESKGENKTSDTSVESVIENGQGNETKASKSKLRLKKSQEGTWEIKNQSDASKTSSPIQKIASENHNSGDEAIGNIENEPAKDKPVNQTPSVDNCSHNTYDSSLPNNQEGLLLSYSMGKSKKDSTDSSVSDLHPVTKNDGNKMKKNGQNIAVPKLKLMGKMDSSNEARVSVKETSDSAVEVISSSEKNNNKELSAIDLCTPSCNKIPEINLLTQENDNEHQNKTLEVTRKSDVIEDTQEQNKNMTDKITEVAGPSGIKNNANNDENPCLKSVSLYEEQFSTSKYSDSESDSKVTPCKDNVGTEAVEVIKNSSEVIDNNKKVSNEIEVEDVVNTVDVNKNDFNGKGKQDVVLLKSHSESESDDFQPPKKIIPNTNLKTKAEREKAIETILGFPSGKSRKRNRSFRERTSSRAFAQTRLGSHSSRANRNDCSNATDSSDYSTLSESEDYSPKTRANRRRGRKHVKPNSYSIRSYPGDGGLFIIDGENVYPIVRHGKNIRNFLSYNPEDDSDGGESYWKKKYLEEKQKVSEEKIRADELARLLRHTENTLQSKSNEVLSTPKESNVKAAETHCNGQNFADGGEAAETKEDKRVKIKITKDNEIELECQWPQVHPVLEKMARLFHNYTEEIPKSAEVEKPNTALVEKSKSEEEKPDTEQIEKPKTEEFEKPKPPDVQKSGKVEKTKLTIDAEVGKKGDDTIDISSGKSTPVLAVVEAEVHEKINKIEGEIFKEIEEKDKTEIVELQTENVTKRKRGRPKSLSPSPSAGKAETKSDNTLNQEDTKNETINAENEIKQQSSKTSVKEVTEDTVKRASRIKRLKSNTDSTEPNNDNISINSKRSTRRPKKPESDVPEPKKSKVKVSKSHTENLKVVIPEDDSQVRYKFPTRDAAPTRGRPRKNDTSVSYAKKTPRIYSSPDNSSINSIESTLGYQDSDASPPKLITIRRKRKSPSTLVSYKAGRRSSVRRKSYPYLADDDSNDSLPCTAPAKLSNSNISLDNDIYRSESYQLLMPKPRLSFNPLDKIEENSPSSESQQPQSHLLIEVRGNKLTIPSLENKKTSQPDTEPNSSNISLPLSPELSIVENISISREMLSNSHDHPTINEIQCNNDSGNVLDTNVNKFSISDVDVSVPLMEQHCGLRNSQEGKRTRKTTVSESFLDRISTVNIQTPSECLHLKLQNLLIESSKKAQKLCESYKENAMDVDTETKLQPDKTKKAKRCSTPRKKGTSKRLKKHLVLEEHTESCLRGGRVSCPPTINVNLEENILDYSEATSNPAEKKGRKKRDIIKVKITRPRNSKGSRKSECKDVTNDRESGIFLQVGDDSADLIHNHSDTCLRANECINDSVVFIDRSKSVISIDSSSIEDDEIVSNGEVRPEWFSNDAQDACVFAKPTTQGSESTVYHSPRTSNSYNSLMTEDLSDDLNQPEPIQNTQSDTVTNLTKWYLLSDDETNTNTNFHDARSYPEGTYVFSNLNQIFTEVCTVPNLSTITENTESNSRKATVDSTK